MGFSFLRALFSTLALLGLCAARLVCDEPPLRGKVENRCALIDRKSKLMLVGTPKASATTAAMLMFKKLGVLDKAMAWVRARNKDDLRSGNVSIKLHDWRREVFQLQPDHAFPTADDLPACAKLCTRPGWLCIQLVRYPLTRFISSFLHTARERDSVNIAPSWPELRHVLPSKASAAAGKFTFRQFVRALRGTARHQQNLAQLRATTQGDDHFLPQTSIALDECMTAATAASAPLAMRLVPIEALAEGLAAVEAEFRPGLGLARLAGKLSGSGHWLSKPAPNRRAGAKASRELSADSADPLGSGTHDALTAELRRSSDGPGRALLDGHGSSLIDQTAAALCGAPEGFAWPRSSVAPCKPPGGLPTYPAFLNADPQVSHSVRCLIKRDLDLYNRHMCSQRWMLARCGACRELCARSVRGLNDMTRSAKNVTVARRGSSAGGARHPHAHLGLTLRGRGGQLE